ncbi:MAG: hypothetical protein R3C13_07920 [Hyphomonas sp.]|uniref:hypothetical protein n=1 Tax=Hyphomonas sp. TaxID=87 RepID=UPI003527C3C5
MPRLSHLDRNCALMAIASLCLSGCISVSSAPPMHTARGLVQEVVQAVNHGTGRVVLTAGPVKFRIG